MLRPSISARPIYSLAKALRRKGIGMNDEERKKRKMSDKPMNWALAITHLSSFISHLLFFAS
jgi:hypothetical protein